MPINVAHGLPGMIGWGSYYAGLGQRNRRNDEEFARYLQSKRKYQLAGRMPRYSGTRRSGTSQLGQGTMPQGVVTDPLADDITKTEEEVIKRQLSHATSHADKIRLKKELEEISAKLSQLKATRKARERALRLGKDIPEEWKQTFTSQDEIDKASERRFKAGMQLASQEHSLQMLERKQQETRLLTNQKTMVDSANDMVATAAQEIADQSYSKDDAKLLQGVINNIRNIATTGRISDPATRMEKLQEQIYKLNNIRGRKVDPPTLDEQFDKETRVIEGNRVQRSEKGEWKVISGWQSPDEVQKKSQEAETKSRESFIKMVSDIRTEWTNNPDDMSIPEKYTDDDLYAEAWKRIAQKVKDGDAYDKMKSASSSPPQPSQAPAVQATQPSQAPTALPPTEAAPEEANWATQFEQNVKANPDLYTKPELADVVARAEAILGRKIGGQQSNIPAAQPSPAAAPDTPAPKSMSIEEALQQLQPQVAPSELVPQQSSTQSNLQASLPPGFIDNKDGTITDTITGDVWKAE